MKICQFFVAAALLVAPTAGYGAIVSVINGDVADQFVAGPSTPGPQNGTGTSVGNPGGITLKVGSVAGSDADRGRNAVYVFQLPNLGPVANPFIAASLSFGVGNIDANTTVNADLYGLTRADAAPNIVVGDYYFGNAADTTGATRLQTDILVAPSPGPGTAPNSIVSTNATGSANLLAFLNARYNSGAGAGRYVYLRLNVDGQITVNNRGYNVHTANEGDAAKRPKINFTAIPEPASVALFALGGLAAVLRRRSR